MSRGGRRRDAARVPPATPLSRNRREIVRDYGLRARRVRLVVTSAGMAGLVTRSATRARAAAYRPLAGSRSLDLPIHFRAAKYSACKNGTGLAPRALSTVPPAVKQCVTQSGCP